MGKKNDSRTVAVIVWLSSYLESKRDLKRLEEQLEETKESTIASAECKGGMPKAKRTTDLSDYQVAVERIEQQINQERMRKVKRLKEVRETIESIEDAKAKDILTYRYIRGYPWKEIARLIGYDISWMFKIHKRAVEEISHKNPYKNML